MGFNRMPGKDVRAPVNLVVMQVKGYVMKRNSHICLKILSIALLLIFGITSANAQTAQQVAKKAFDSTVLLVMEDANGQPLSLGSFIL